MPATSSNTSVIIVAAGTGSRFGAPLPKQFLPLGGRPVLFHTISAFRNALPLSRILLVLSPSMVEYWNGLCDDGGFSSPEIVAGGATRWESVKNAVATLADASPASTVLIHDAARPLVPAKVITTAASYARNTDGAIPVVPVTSSLRMLSPDECSSHPVDRSLFREVQTPQAFSLWRLREAFTLPYTPEFTDDASVMAAAGFSNIVLFPGAVRNIKITSPADMIVAEALLAHPEIE